MIVDSVVRMAATLRAFAGHAGSPISAAHGRRRSILSAFASVVFPRRFRWRILCLFFGKQSEEQFTLRFVWRPGEKLTIMIEVLAVNEVLHGADQGH